MSYFFTTNEENMNDTVSGFIVIVLTFFSIEFLAGWTGLIATSMGISVMIYNVIGSYRKNQRGKRDEKHQKYVLEILRKKSKHD